MAAAVRLMTYNLYEGGAGGGVRRLDLVAEVVRAARPDLLALCEAHGMAEDARLFADFQAAVGMRGRVVAAPTGYNLGLLARLPHAVAAFEGVDVGGLNPMGAGVARLAGIGDVLVVVAHLDYRDARARQREAESLLRLLEPGQPLLVMGDLNALSHQDGLTRADLMALPLHHVERHVGAEGELDFGTTRAFDAAGLVDLWRAANPGAPTSDAWTVPTGVPVPPRFGPMRIDYVLASSDLAALLASARVVRDEPAPRASDHFPLMAELAAR